MDEASFTKLKTSGGNLELQNTLTQLKERKEELWVQINGFNYNTIGPMSFQSLTHYKDSLNTVETLIVTLESFLKQKGSR